MKTKIDKFETQEEWDSWIGYKISKHSNKPFKGGELIVTAVDITINSYSNKKAFKVSDGSIVDCYQCKLEITQ